MLTKFGGNSFLKGLIYWTYNKNVSRETFRKEMKT